MDYSKMAASQQAQNDKVAQEELFKLVRELLTKVDALTMKVDGLQGRKTKE